jgi:hypothetical protein
MLHILTTTWQRRLTGKTEHLCTRRIIDTTNGTYLLHDENPNRQTEIRRQARCFMIRILTGKKEYDARMKLHRATMPG